MYSIDKIRKAVVVALLCGGGVFGVVAAAHSQTIAAHLYTDQQLIEAGWTETQIAEMRAQAPTPASNPETENITDPPQESSDSPKLISFTSVFDNYMSFDDTPEIGWREANDAVGRIGGWRTYTKQVQEAQKKEKMAELGTDKK